jgi:hypothetical protein
MNSAEDRVVGGILDADTPWLPSAGAYTVGSTLQIPAGHRLHIAAGAQVTAAASPMFLVHGLLTASGTATRPVTFDGNATADFFSTRDSSGDAGVEISDATIRNGASLIPATGHEQYAYLRLTDSRVESVRGMSYLWYPVRDDVVERNVFSNSGGFSIGTNTGHFYFRNNRFRTASTTGYWVQDWAGYNGPANRERQQLRRRRHAKRRTAVRLLVRVAGRARQPLGNDGPQRHRPHGLRREGRHHDLRRHPDRPGPHRG